MARLVGRTNHQLKEGEKLKLHPPILSNFATLIALEALMGATGQLLSTDDFTQLIHLSDWVPAEKPPCNDCSALIKVSAVQRHRVWWVGLPKMMRRGLGVAASRITHSRGGITYIRWDVVTLSCLLSYSLFIQLGRFTFYSIEKIHCTFI